MRRARNAFLLAVVAGVAGYSLLYIWHLLPLILSQPVPPDWEQHRIAAERIAAGSSPYFMEEWYRFRWSPIGAWVLVPITALGPVAWTVAQFAALLALPRLLAVVTLLAFPFWADVQAGNIMVFTFVAAFHALRGNRIGGGAFLAMALIVPRPVVLPLVAWLAWRHASWRVPITVAALVSGIGAVATGYHVAWVDTLGVTGAEEAHRLGAQLLPAWPISGAAIAGLLTVLGLPAIAGFALQPYWLAYYGLLPLLHLPVATKGLLAPGPSAASVARAQRATARTP